MVKHSTTKWRHPDPYMVPGAAPSSVETPLRLLW
ncbi:unnamed protein product [Brassica rapa subsp. trilocularis]